MTASITPRDSYDISEFLRAIADDDPGRLSRALEDPAAGPDPELCQGALFLSAMQGKSACASWLIPHALPEQPDSNGECALMKAASHGRLECAELLLPFSDPKAANRMGQTALHLAAAAGHAKLAELLLSSSDPGAQDNLGLTPLMAAAAQGHAECAMLLLAATDESLSPILSASDLARKNGHAQLARLIDSFYQAQDERRSLDQSALPHNAHAPKAPKL